MRQRIVAAWKVLRGEWVAKPPEPTFTIYWNGSTVPGAYTSSGTGTVSGGTWSHG